DFPKTEAGVRTVLVPPDYSWLMDRIRLQNPFGDYIFVENGKHLTTNTFRTRLRSICKKLDIVNKSPHKIRKTYGTILLDNNIDEKFITGQMGHTNILCTEQHYHRNRKTINQKAALLGSIPEFQQKAVK
ncbi:MAG: tyrosine-type recombinase/integrase, partial [Anaerotignum sp.]